MSYPPPGDQNQPPQYPSNQPPQQPQQPQPPQQPYGGGAPGYGYGYPPAPPTPDDGYTTHMERPGVVTAGSVIAIVLSALSALAAAAVLVGAIVAWDDLIDEFRSDPDQYELSANQINDIADAQAGVIIVVAIWLAIAVFGVLLGLMTMKGHNWARITMVVFAVLTLLLALVMITSVVSAVWLIGAIACIICVFVGGANDWFRYQKQQRQQQF